MMIEKEKDKFISCFRCGTLINSENQIFYVFIGKTKTENAEYCTDCYLKEMQEMHAMYPYMSTSIYAKNFIRMNK